jgi:molybdopterin-biosynthesis enzyme MoeA-like protein
MTEIENQNSEVLEVAPQVENQVTEAKETQQSQEPVNNQHLKAMRLKNAELERELKQLREAQMQIMQAQLANSQPQRQVETDEFDKIGDDEFIPLGKVKKLAERNTQKVLKNAEDLVRIEVEKALKKQQDNQFMDRLNRQFSDFSEVVNPETLSILEEKEPDLAATIADLKDPYKIGVQSYKYIKAMGLSQTAKEVRREKEIDKAIAKSEKAVTSPMAFDKRPIAQAFKLTDAMKKDLYREMHGYAALANSVPEMT